MKNKLKRHSVSSLSLTACLILVMCLFVPDTPASAGYLADASPAVLVVLDRNQAAVDKITDGDQIRIQITVVEKVTNPLLVEFRLGGGGDSIGNCEILVGTNICRTELIASRGWRWLPGGQAKENRTIQASVGSTAIGSALTIQVAPRPVVMVHGFSSSWVAWQNYLGPEGFLVKNGLHGFAVGDGQEPGTLNTGNINSPTERTNTIAENAAILN